MEPNEDKYSKHRPMRKYALGIVVIFAGFFLLLFNTGIMSYGVKHILFSWQMLLIVIGLISLFSSESRTPGYILLLIGGIFILPRIFEMPFNVMHLFWPLILIALGVILLMKRMPHYKKENRSSTQSVDDGYLHEENIFSGSKQRFIHSVFRGGNISCLFGGAEIDLTQTTLAEGTSELEITTIFGGVTLIVPSDWKVVLRTTSIFGGFSDKRIHVKECSDPARILIIKGSTIFGGGEIKSY